MYFSPTLNRIRVLEKNAVFAGLLSDNNTFSVKYLPVFSMSI